ncbi:MAG TPA: FAD-dependent monooxygenase [Cyclobacteriaceae bacterium]|nr:FAD-dependent monooxygenase [Cyclobacteriaceae bacterium]
MNAEPEILIVGAGPSGLAAALFLSQEGLHPRIIEKNDGLSLHSKALGVNPRTLLLLEQSGLTKRFLDNGRKMEKINFWKGNQLVFQNDLTKVRHKYQFMLIQPQMESERMLLEELVNRKVEVEFGTAFQSISHSNDHLNTVISTPRGYSVEHPYRLVVGADGARSKVRELSGIKTSGFRYEEEWELYDIQLDVPRQANEGHVVIMEEGGIVMIRLKEDIWRVAGNIKELLNHLPKNTKVGKIVWQSTFKISHRVAVELFRDKVLLIGDAAHLHSPVGARGMNLGIEDAYIISQLIKEDSINTYTSIRQDYLMRTVRRINAMTQGLGGSNFLLRKVRANITFLKPLFPLAMPIARKFILGLNK